MVATIEAYKHNIGDDDPTFARSWTWTRIWTWTLDLDLEKIF